MRKPDRCQMCSKNDAVWLILDSKMHTYYEAVLTESLELDLEKRKQRDAYLVCTSCKSQIIKQNRAGRKTKPRDLKLLRWE